MVISFCCFVLSSFVCFVTVGVSVKFTVGMFGLLDENVRGWLNSFVHFHLFYLLLLWQKMNNFIICICDSPLVSYDKEKALSCCPKCSCLVCYGSYTVTTNALCK